MKRRTPLKAAKPLAKLTQGQLGALLGTSQQRVSQLVKEGLFAPLKNGRIDPFVAVPAYVRAVRKVPDEAMGRIRAARAREIEQRVAREANRLILLDDVLEATAEIVGAFRAELSGLPAACTRDLTERAVIERNLNGAIDRTRRRLDAMGKAVASGRPLLEDDGAGDED
jgi:hypothetical protein